jgi:phage-related minor tail protein
MKKTMETQLADITTYAKTKLEQHLSNILDPIERGVNPYTPIDRALKKISKEIMDMVHKAIQEIDIVIQGTVDQAIEDVRLSTRHNAQPAAQPPPPSRRDDQPSNTRRDNPP